MGWRDILLAITPLDPVLKTTLIHTYIHAAPLGMTRDDGLWRGRLLIHGGAVPAAA
jgi:hypothetical protein